MNQMSFQREKKGLLKLLSNKKKLRPSPPSSPTLETEQSISMEMPQGAVGPEMAQPSSASVAVGHNGRAVPCPMDSELSVSSSSSNADAASHRSSSQDNAAPIAPPPRQPCSSLLSMQHDGRPIVCERYNNTQKSTFTPLEHCLSFFTIPPGTVWWCLTLPKAKQSWNSRRETLYLCTENERTAGLKEHYRETVEPGCFLAALLTVSNAHGV